jgi:hypothetical protein
MSTFTDNLQLDFSPMAPRVTHCSAAQLLGTDPHADSLVLLVGIDFRIESREVNGFLSFILDADATDLLISAVGSHIKRLGIDY